MGSTRLRTAQGRVPGKNRIPDHAPGRDLCRHGASGRASGFLLKQSASSELLTAIREVLAGQTYITPPLAERLAQMSAESPAENQADLPTLTLRQREVLQLFAEGRRPSKWLRHSTSRRGPWKSTRSTSWRRSKSLRWRNSCNMPSDMASSPAEPTALFLYVARPRNTDLAPISRDSLVTLTPRK